MNVGSLSSGQPATEGRAQQVRQVDQARTGEGDALWQDDALGRVVRAELAGDHAVARLAQLQHGVASRAQLLALGFGKQAIQSRLDRGLLHMVHRGVYNVGHTAPMPLAREMAAVLACGPRAVAGHRSSGYVWALLPQPRGDVHVSGATRGQRSGIRAHRVPVDRNEVTRCRGIPLTSPARTMVDLAAEVEPLQLESLVADAERRGLMRRRELAAAAEAGGQRSGGARLRELLRHEHAPSLTRSDTERRFLRLIRAASLPPPDHNVPVGQYELDTLWRDARVVVELDGYEFHSSRAAFDRDRARDAELQASGFVVLRFTWRQVKHRPELVIALLARTLALRSS
jgi:very-short-patch-repair endonuclease